MSEYGAYITGQDGHFIRAVSIRITKVLVITIHRMISPYVVTAAILTALSPALAQPIEGDPAAGRQTATKLCSSCHQVLPIFLPDKADAPSFQSIADLPSTTGISLYVFLHSNHRNMPNLILSSAEANDLIAYILSLKKNWELRDSELPKCGLAQ